MAGPTLLLAAIAAPWGPLNVAVTDRGVVAVESLTPPAAFAEALERRMRRTVGRVASSAPARQRRLLDRAVDSLEAYLAGSLREFALPLDLDPHSSWDRAVFGGVRQIPYGTVTSYGRLARRIGRPGAARAVGGAVGRNPIGILVPCHRVIAGDGSLGGYGGDWWGTREQLLTLKRELLALEGVTLPVSGGARDPRWADAESGLDGASVAATLPG